MSDDCATKGRSTMAFIRRAPRTDAPRPYDGRNPSRRASPGANGNGRSAGWRRRRAARWGVRGRQARRSRATRSSPASPTKRRRCEAANISTPARSRRCGGSSPWPSRTSSPAATPEGPPLEIAWGSLAFETYGVMCGSHLIRPPAAWTSELARDAAALQPYGLTLSDLREFGTPPREIAAHMNEKSRPARTVLNRSGRRRAHPTDI